MTLQFLELKFIKNIFTVSIISISISLLNITKGAAEQKNPFDTVQPNFSVSNVESSFAPLLNPAFSDMPLSPNVSYRIQSFEHKKNSNHFFLANLAGFNFGYSWIDNLYNEETGIIIPAKSKLFSIGKGFLFGNIFGCGINYYYNKSNKKGFDDYRSASLGFLLRPVSFLSLGYVVNDINNPEIKSDEISRSEIYSLSIRPFKDYLTLSVDAKKWQGKEIDKSNILFSASLHLKYSISVYASANRDKDFTFGMSLPLGFHHYRSSSFILDGCAAFNADDRPNSSAFGIAMTSERSSSSLLKSKRLLKIVLNESISEVRAKKLFKGDEPVFYDLLKAIDAAKDDESIAGIILRIDRAVPGFAQVQELREQLKKFRSKHKKVYAILANRGNKEYYLAAASDEIIYSPTGLFSLTGLSSEVYFLKTALDKLGIKFESIKKGKYKSFTEQFTKEHMSKEFRENLTTLLSDLNEQFISDIARDRPVSREKIKELFSKGVIEPEEARKAGFIDEVEYPDNAEEKILDSYKFVRHSVNYKDYINENVTINEWGPIPGIAVVHVSGSIIRGKSQGYGGLSSKAIGGETYGKALDRAFNDSSIKAVIIRVNSGGGSAVASELMRNYLASLKKKHKKPVVFSFGNVAASGGYYIACTGDKIFGSKGSIVGSIGVVAGKLSLKELYSKLGINKDIIKMSEFADIFSEAKDLTIKERKIIEQGVDYIYKGFTNKVSEARGIPKEKIDKVAEGRVFSGNEAKNNGLIDNYGGLLTAVKFAKKIANIRGYYTVKHLPEVKASILEFLGLNYGKGILSKQLNLFLESILWVEFYEEHALYYWPYRIVIE